jgi:hypothetical protein
VKVTISVRTFIQINNFDLEVGGVLDYKRATSSYSDDILLMRCRIPGFFSFNHNHHAIDFGRYPLVSIATEQFRRIWVVNV